MKKQQDDIFEVWKLFEHEPPVLLAWTCNKPFSAPNSDVCLASLCVGHTNLCLVTNWAITSIVNGTEPGP